MHKKDQDKGVAEFAALFMLTNKSTCYARGTKELPAVNRGYDTRAGKIKNLCFLLPEGPPFLYVKEKE